MNIRGITTILGVSSLMLFSQSCATRSLMIDPTTYSSLETHPSFSMTGSTKKYDPFKGHTDFYTKQLEEIYPTGVIDFINSPDPLVRSIIEKIPFDASFYLVLVNASGIKHTMIQINDEYIPASLGQTKAWTKYSFAPYSNSSLKLEKLRLHLRGNSGDSVDINESALPCVAMNAPGPKGEYRNGALTLQIVDASSSLKNGPDKNARLLAEFTVHKENSKTTCQ